MEIRTDAIESGLPSRIIRDNHGVKRVFIAYRANTIFGILQQTIIIYEDRVIRCTKTRIIYFLVEFANKLIYTGIIGMY